MRARYPSPMRTRKYFISYEQDAPLKTTRLQQQHTHTKNTDWHKTRIFSSSFNSDYLKLIRCGCGSCETVGLGIEDSTAKKTGRLADGLTFIQRPSTEKLAFRPGNAWNLKIFNAFQMLHELDERVFIKEKRKKQKRRNCGKTNQMWIPSNA